MLEETEQRAKNFECGAEIKQEKDLSNNEDLNKYPVTERVNYSRRPLSRRERTCS